MAHNSRNGANGRCEEMMQLMTATGSVIKKKGGCSNQPQTAISLACPFITVTLNRGSQMGRNGAKHDVNGNRTVPPFPEGLQMVLFGMGCFWGAERKFWMQKGVYSTQVGYSGGYTPNPTYEEVCTGKTGHAEVVRVVYEPEKINLAQLLKVFWESHNPTQGMRQGNDVGTTYRSTIYAYTQEQLTQALRSKDEYQKNSSVVETKIEVSWSRWCNALQTCMWFTLTTPPFSVEAKPVGTIEAEELTVVLAGCNLPNRTRVVSVISCSLHASHQISAAFVLIPKVSAASLFYIKRAQMNSTVTLRSC
ncbi:Mitochondrial peptide methionine sulfoxide reductase [Anabarilius grahami]|uniref:peptide-methionine (S)-S-oxide reductase n=1 Tax=Anabarilius grahami TaxID=495550 RepID=A0A3N0Z1Y3_ANAGA|nr:Mitochondrial peptide methionine sulfoxide reductase [Anabarilius grahami]